MVHLKGGFREVELVPSPKGERLTAQPGAHQDCHQRLKKAWDCVCLNNRDQL